MRQSVACRWRRAGRPRIAPGGSSRTFAASFYKSLSTAVLGKEITGGVMKRPEYREAGKVGSCENCSAWKDVGTRRGVWGARVEMKLLAPHCPPCAPEKMLDDMIGSRFSLGGTRAPVSFLNTRAPKPPGSGCTPHFAQEKRSQRHRGFQHPTPTSERFCSI